MYFSKFAADAAWWMCEHQFDFASVYINAVYKNGVKLFGSIFFSMTIHTAEAVYASGFDSILDQRSACSC